MSWMNSIISWLGSARDYLLSAYWTVSGWISPFNNLATPLYYIFLAFYYLTSSFIDFNNWLVWAAGRINQILDISTITSYFQTWINYATVAYNFIVGIWNYVRAVIEGWWGEVYPAIQTQFYQLGLTITGYGSQLLALMAPIQAWWNDWSTVTFPQWIATLQDLWNQFTTLVASIGQTILSHLNAWWDSTIFPALQSIWQFLSSLNIPSWDEITNYVYSLMPGIADFLNWWSELSSNVKSFFTYPINWLLDKFSFDNIADPLINIIEGAGGTDAYLSDIASTLPDIKTVSGELIDILSSEELMKADEFWADVELALNEVISELEAAEAKKGAI